MIRIHHPRLSYQRFTSSFGWAAIYNAAGFTGAEPHLCGERGKEMVFRQIIYFQDLFLEIKHTDIRSFLATIFFLAKEDDPLWQAWVRFSFKLKLTRTIFASE